MYNSVLAEGRCTKKMVDGLAVDGEAGLAITDHDLAVGVDAQEFTHVALLWLTVRTLLAFSCEHREHMIPWRQICYSLANALHNSVIIYISHPILRKVYWISLAKELIKKIEGAETQSFSILNENRIYFGSNFLILIIITGSFADILNVTFFLRKGKIIWIEFLKNKQKLEDIA